MRKCHACELWFDHRHESACPWCGAVPLTLQKLQAENARLRAQVTQLQEHQKKCAHGECCKCGVTPHPWCFKPAEEPQDAEVREAVERLENSEYTIALDGSQDDTPQMWADIDVLIAYVRAVQSPRLTGEQVKEAYLNGYEDGNEDGRALTGCRNVYEHTPRYAPDIAWTKSDTRAAFPDVFGKEG